MTIPVGSPNSRAPLADILDRARRQDLPLPELIQLAETLSASGHAHRAVDLYKSWIAYNGDHPYLHLVYFNYSVTLRLVDDQAGAINALRACIAMERLFGPAHINLGRSLEDAGQVSLAIAQWRKLADATPDITAERVSHKLMALQHIGRTLENLEQLSAAEDALKQALELRPDKTETGQHWIALRQKQCKWPVLQVSEHVPQRKLIDAISPMSLAAFADDPMFQLAKAYRYNLSFVGRPDTRGFARVAVKRKTGTGQRLRIGYVSSDLRDHAVGFALSEVLELHDKRQVEIFAYSFGEGRSGDATQERIRAVVDHWRDINALSDLDAANKIVEDQIDILVDVNGYTKFARTRIFAYRPAPVIVNWCGYPGTMGSPYHQYMITDGNIVPETHERYYSEKVLRIPCNQPIDRKRFIDPARPSRADAGLPEEAVVFASFNGMQKVTVNTYARWMAILQKVPGSVLWVLTGTDETNERLRSVATQLGVASDRIIFASKAPNPKHLARLALADLFLDTLPYGAHSTAADALTMGLPVLTLPGRTFASRFCASVVASAGVPELICSSPEDYVRRAVEFGLDRSKIRACKERLAQARGACVLRDIPELVRQLEALYWLMQGDAEAGRLPVPDLTNLDTYFEIGAELDLANIELLSDEAYQQAYGERLERLNDHSPLPRDVRFWPSPE